MSNRSAGKGPTPWKKQPYGGYYQSRTPDYEPLLTETGQGTPMGEYMRRFWHPVCLSEELTDVPRYIKILGEELVAFRDKSGRVGVLALHCTHRGASLEYGLIQECGIILLKSAKMARYMTENVPGIDVPDALTAEIDEAKDKSAKSIEIAARIVNEIKPMCQGIHIMPLGWEAKIPALLEAVNE